MAAKPVVVGTDGSEVSLRAVEWAAAEAARRSAPLRIVSVMAVLSGLADLTVVGRHDGSDGCRPRSGSILHSVLNHAQGAIAVVPSA